METSPGWRRRRVGRDDCLKVCVGDGGVGSEPEYEYSQEASGRGDLADLHEAGRRLSHLGTPCGRVAVFGTTTVLE